MYNLSFLKKTLLVLLLLMASPALASTDKADLVVAMKVLPLLSEKITGTTSIAIIFDPANPASKEEAESIKNLLQEGLEMPGDIKLIPVLVLVNNLGAATGSRLAILTAGLNAYYDDIQKLSESHKILTMTTDLSCVRANKCIIGIVSKPSVDIYYSKSAAAAAQIEFSQVFALLVKQI